MGKYTVEEIKRFQELGILTAKDAAELIDAIVVSEKSTCVTTEADSSLYELKDLVDEYGLPLKVKMPRFYGDFYFLAEKVDERRHMIDGRQFSNGHFYRGKKRYLPNQRKAKKLPHIITLLKILFLKKKKETGIGKHCNYLQAIAFLI